MDGKKKFIIKGRLKNYVGNYRDLRFTLSLGVKLKKVNRVLPYTQSDILKKILC